MKKNPLGQDNYKELIENGFYYVDKTLFIKDILEQSRSALPFLRPRRFGKTLNLSMLRAFFEHTQESNEHLFTDKAIWNFPEYKALQGTFPVIFMTFKDVRAGEWSATYERLADEIAKEYARHDYLLTSLKAPEKKKFDALLHGEASPAMLMTSLADLAYLLYKHHQKKVMMFIDEYDVPMQDAYINDYYKKAAPFFGTLFASALKGTTDFVEKAVLTGVLMLAKEGIFTGLNNFTAFNILKPLAADKFGFTEYEIQALIEYYGIEGAGMKGWYNGCAPQAHRNGVSAPAL